MSCDSVFYPLEQATSGVQGLHPYLPGKPVSELQRELGLSHIVKLASNENPLGPSDAVLNALQGACAELSRYPDGSCFELKQALSQFLDVLPTQLTVGNGSNDVLNLIARAFLAPDDEAVFSEYAFAVYPIATQAVGAKGVVAPAKQWGHDLTAMAEAITARTKVVFLANPNNPTGTQFDRVTFCAFMDKVPAHVIVVLDEAYGEYLAACDGDYPDGLTYLDTYANLIVCRTFSKAYGLAALRVGYAVSHPEVADVLNRVRSPFNVNSFAQAAAIAALNDQSYIEQTVKLNRAGLVQVIDALQQAGLDYIPSNANFVAVDFGVNAADIHQAFLREGVILRPLAPYNMPSFLRVSIGLEQENAVFIKALNSAAIRALQ